MLQFDSSAFDAILTQVGDTPFSAAPFFFLQRQACDVYATSRVQPQCLAIVPHISSPDVYVLGAASLDRGELESLAGFLAGLEPVAGFFVPVELVQPVRTRCLIDLQVEGLCFTYPQIPSGFQVSRPEFARRLEESDAALLEGLPGDAAFLWQNYGTAADLLAEGLAFGVIRQGKLVSLAASLVLTPKYCDVGVYTLTRHRNLGYATDGVEALFAFALAQGVRPLWRIGVRQKVAIKLAEKLLMEEIGTNGREMYLQATPEH